MSKFQSAIAGTPFNKLPTSEQEFIEKVSNSESLSFQEIRRLVDISTDLTMWGERKIESLWPDDNEVKGSGQQRNKNRLSSLQGKIDLIKSSKSYSNFGPEIPRKVTTNVIQKDSEHTILGECPVASEKTRCCNLKTLDAVRNCGFDCSYCSIQSFYYDDKVYFDAGLSEKLQKLDLDPNKDYHIGTGQSSDSLMWGNTKGLLDDLFDFARNNPNVILELKTKSDNISYLLENEIPKNIITTWSLNPQTIVENEEHLAAGLENRLGAAKKIHDKGALVGFHFHPIVHYEGWKSEYSEITNRIATEFKSERVALISLGTLTFIKPAIKKLKKRLMKSKILQMPMEEIAGKLSYPLDIKRELFTHLFTSFPEKWRDKVFFYMCMEDLGLWQQVFGRSYKTNDEFESDMISNYRKKINSLDNL
ncbi:MAG: hypothetical protein KAG61_11925 [Bacteriovoracaceae bacterium]|nr:hypothetical protein [Bacteriovoracaceae bacterium]